MVYLAGVDAAEITRLEGELATANEALTTAMSDLETAQTNLAQTKLDLQVMADNHDAAVTRSEEFTDAANYYSGTVNSDPWSAVLDVFNAGIDSVDITADNQEAISTYLAEAKAAAEITKDLDALADRNNPLKSISVNDSGQIVIARWDDNNTAQNYTTQTIVGVNTDFLYEADSFLQAYADRLTTLAAYGIDYAIDLSDVVEAYQEGFKEGYDEGYKDGYRDGFADGVDSVTQ